MSLHVVFFYQIKDDHNYVVTVNNYEINVLLSREEKIILFKIIREHKHLETGVRIEKQAICEEFNFFLVFSNYLQFCICVFRILKMLIVLYHFICQRRLSVDVVRNLYWYSIIS